MNAKNGFFPLVLFCDLNKKLPKKKEKKIYLVHAFFFVP